MIATPRLRRREGGQATVELALALPLVLTLLLGVVQVGLVVRDHVLTIHAAREGARAAAVDRRPGAARSAALAGTGLAADATHVTVGNRGEPGSRVRVEVSHRSATDVPLVGALIGDVEVRATAVMRVEG